MERERVKVRASARGGIGGLIVCGAVGSVADLELI